ncbi:unnamed protein product [[Candida] boidinii]|uniref:Unnamed protein product n=1 Tax=Candida boidinii TaxID=5477 RepID=A0A9W6T011_CANBO|nr:unnamed protein product [[Candida] boidinii]
MNNDVDKISNECEKIMVSIRSKYSEDEIKKLIEKVKKFKSENNSQKIAGDDVDVDQEENSNKELQIASNGKDRLSQDEDDDRKLKNGSVKDSTKEEVDDDSKEKKQLQEEENEEEKGKEEEEEKGKEEGKEDRDILIVESLLDDTRNEYINKAKRFKQLIERSQAKNLATTVVEKENEVLKNKDIELKPIEINEKTISFVLELISLQLFRKRAVDDILTLYADASENTETISKYRRLVSKLSKVPIQEVDESLNGIEECLKHDDL